MLILIPTWAKPCQPKCQHRTGRRSFLCCLNMSSFMQANEVCLKQGLWVRLYHHEESTLLLMCEGSKTEQDVQPAKSLALMLSVWSLGGALMLSVWSLGGVLVAFPKIREILFLVVCSVGCFPWEWLGSLGCLIASLNLETLVHIIPSRYFNWAQS